MLYFIEDARGISRNTLKDAGLAGMITRPKNRHHVIGPGEKPGLLIADESFNRTSEGVDFCFKRETQTWLPRFGRPGTWVGMWNDRPPTPADLARKKQLPGYAVQMLDGNAWQIPLLREWVEEDERPVWVQLLPSVLKRSLETGIMIKGDVVPEYRQVWEASLAIADRLILSASGKGVEFDEGQLDQFVGDLLAINYRIGLDEIGLLGLMGEDNYKAVVHAALDWERLLEIGQAINAKKKTAESQSQADIDLTSGDDLPTAAPEVTTGQL